MQRLDQVRLLIFDTETTGTSVSDDRVIELGAAYFEAAQVCQGRRTLVNPGCPIPADATRIHGIADEHVKDAPSFAEVAPRFMAHMDGSALGKGAPLLAGYNALGFDVPLLNAELARAGISARVPEALILDVLVFARWHHRNLRARNLESLCNHYGIVVGRAHSASADARATGRLLLAMVAAGKIPPTVPEALAEQARLRARLEAEWARFSYWLYEDRVTGELRIGCGKHTGKPVDTIDAGFFQWALGMELPDEVRALFTDHAARAVAA